MRNAQHQKGPRVIIEFTDELARQLASDRVEAVIKEHLASEACMDVRAAAQLLGVAVSAFRRFAKKIPLVDLGECTHRYRVKDILAYRDRRLTQPKNV